jgi:ABC-type transporter Mla subunit MlaD
MSSLTEVLSGFGARINALTPSIAETSEAMTGPLRHDPRALRQRVRLLARELDTFVKWLKGANTTYREALDVLTSSLDHLFSAGDLAEARAQFPQLASVIGEIETSAEGSRAQMTTLVDVLDSLPRVEKDFNRAKRALAEELSALIGNVDQTIAVFARTRQAGEGLFGVASAT